jgi:hypothetical protein
MTSNNIYTELTSEFKTTDLTLAEFKPTYLYIKQHTITGKLYFGKTIKRDPEKYPGSGSHWLNHIKKHGPKHVVTEWYCLFLEEKECTEFALNFSNQNNIVESTDWANQIPEDGLNRISSFSFPETREKGRQTRLTNTGYEYPAQNPVTLEKMKQTHLTNTGYKHNMQNPETQEKSRQTHLAKTGYEYPGQNPETQEKMKQTLLTRTGHEHALQNPETREKRRQTLLENTGYEHPLQNPVTREKRRQNNLAKTGFEYSTQNPETQEKSRQTLLTRTGYENPMQNPETQEKSRQTKKNKPILTCPHCGQSGKYANPMQKNHFDNCKFKS